MHYKFDCLKRVKNDWYHKWCCLYDCKLRDCVKGPLKYPMVTVPIPYITEGKDEIDQCNCSQHTKNCYSKPGIPDPWDEYLIFKRESKKGIGGVTCDFPKWDLDITRSLNRNHRVYLGQGIPDPWKKFMRLESLEPSLDKGGRKLENSTENLPSGSGCGVHDSEKVCCPNCRWQSTVLCMKRAEVEGDKNVDPVSEIDEEKPAERKIHLKDACVETDPFHDLVQVAGTSGCNFEKICDCRKTCLVCSACNRLRKESKAERSGREKYDSLNNCNRNSIKNDYFRNMGHHCSIRSKPIRKYCCLTDQSCNYRLPKREHHQNRLILPLFYGSFGICACSSQHLIDFEQKNNHSLELRLMCAKCEKKRKKRKKAKYNGSGERRNDNSLPCNYRKNCRDTKE